jgi:hypothetical protein
MWRILPVLMTLVMLILIGWGCASPREREIKQAMKDYRRASASANEFAKEQVRHLTSAARLFHAAHHRWPYSLAELSRFTTEKGIVFNDLAFTRTTFAAMPNGDAHVSYEVDCQRWNTGRFSILLPGNVTIAPP